MKTLVICSVASSLLAALFLLSGCKEGEVSLWESKCSSCHDGKTVLNDQVAPDREELRHKYRNIEQFMMACLGAPACMNILKHDEALFREVGREIGIPES